MPFFVNLKIQCYTKNQHQSTTTEDFYFYLFRHLKKDYKIKSDLDLFAEYF